MKNINAVIQISIMNIFLLVIFVVVRGASPYDDRSGIVSEPLQRTVDPENINFMAESAPSAWENNVNTLIQRGILHLTLKLDEILTGSAADEHRLADGRKNNLEENVIISPFNIAHAMALILLGSNGQTATEIVNALGLGNQLNNNREVIHTQIGRILTILENKESNEKAQIVTACGLFVQSGFPIKQRYYDLSRNLYHSEVQNLDFERNGFEAQKVINNWVNTRTNGVIKTILQDPPDPSSKVILATALYFKGEWMNKFAMEATASHPFFVDKNAGDVIQLPTMITIGNFPHATNDKLKCQILGMPYKANDATFYIILPDSSGIDALRQLEENLSVRDLEDLVNSVTVKRGSVHLPRMKLEFFTSLQTALNDLGIKSLFDPNAADLSNLSGVEPANGAYLSNRINRDDCNSSSENINSTTDCQEFNITIPEIDSNNDTSNSIHNSSTDYTTDNNSTEKYQSVVNKRSIPEFSGNPFVRHSFKRKRQANFSQNPQLYVDDVYHKVEIEVTETGTVAAATTLVSITRIASNVKFEVNKPFIFFIRHEATGLILFWGSVVRPTPL